MCNIVSQMYKSSVKFGDAKILRGGMFSGTFFCLFIRSLWKVNLRENFSILTFPLWQSSKSIYAVLLGVRHIPHVRNFITEAMSQVYLWFIATSITNSLVSHVQAFAAKTQFATSTDLNHPHSLRISLVKRLLFLNITFTRTASP